LFVNYEVLPLFWDWGLNSGLHLSLNSSPFWRWVLANFFFAWAGLEPMLLILASQVARIIGVSHKCLPGYLGFFNTKESSINEHKNNVF
jgi:hypothetical protein